MSKRWNMKGESMKDRVKSAAEEIKKTKYRRKKKNGNGEGIAILLERWRRKPASNQKTLEG